MGETFDYIKNKNINFSLINCDVNALKGSGYLVGYSLVLRSYYKVIYKSPYPSNLSAFDRVQIEKARFRHLTLFAIVGAPIVVSLYKLQGYLWTDKPTLSFSINNNGLNENTKNINFSSSLFLFILNLNKKIPDWLKFGFKFIILSIIILKLLGVKSIPEILNNLYYLKLYLYISCSLIILYHFLNIYLIYKFSKSDSKISEFYPEFIIKWLSSYKEFSNKNELIKDLKIMHYKEIALYLFILILITILL